MQKLKVMTIVGTRPEIIRLSQVIQAFDRYFDHCLVHTGQNWDYTLNGIFFEEMQLRKPDHFLNCVGENLGATMGNILALSYQVMLEEKPDALLILGDTNSALSAISAKRLKIPIFHMEAGNRCFDQNVPEEINRRIVDHIADMNLAYTEHSRRYLISEGLRGDRIFVTGSPIPEVLLCNREKIAASIVLDRLELTAGNYFVVSAHREENIENPDHFLSLMRGVNQVAETYSYPVIYSTHPRSMKAIVEKGFLFHPLVRNLPPFGFPDYVHLQQNAFCVLSDSGTLSEESAVLGFPGVLIRTSTERPEVLDQGGIVMGGIQAESMLQAVELATELRKQEMPRSLPPDYRDTNVAEKVVKLVLSYAKLVRCSI